MRQKEYKIREEKLRNLHHNKRKTPAEIADYFGCSRSLIYHYFDKFNIDKLPKHERLKGKEFGKLTVKEYLGINDNRQAEWRCKCSCGNKTIATTAQLKFGKKKSCGCLQKEKASTHQMSGSRPYRIWLGMKSRCGNEDAWNYQRYGGRGISYAKRWENFENFWEDMKDGYSKDKTLERKDNNGDYTPENCRWATVKEQNRNKRNNVKLTLNGETKTASEWSNQLDIPLKTIYERVNQGWNDKRVLTTQLKTSQ